jgi:RHS repeat-associated protein
MSIVNGVTTVYLGDYYEYEVGSGITRSYYGGVAMRVAGASDPAGNGVFYLLKDHLGSTNLIVDSSGSLVGETRYKAWGETRYASGDSITNFGYTGQRQESDLGFYYYKARWYDPALGRFLQADTIVPEPGNPMALDRYGYGGNNPIRFIDPTGHFDEAAIWRYLVQQYGDSAYRYWVKWKADDVLWSLLSEATANDVLVYVDGDQVHFARFLGEGQDELWGTEDLPLPDIGSALGAKHDRSNDIGLTNTLNKDIVGLFTYTSRAHLELKFSGAGIGTWDTVEAREITAFENTLFKTMITVPAALLHTGEAWALARHFGMALAGWELGDLIANYLPELKPGNDRVFASNGMGHSLNFTLDRGLVVSLFLSRWEWPDTEILLP